MTNKTQNIPIPYTQRVLERTQQNWRDRKVEILCGAGLSVLGLALIPYYRSVFCDCLQRRACCD